MAQQPTLLQQLEGLGEAGESFLQSIVGKIGANLDEGIATVATLTSILNGSALLEITRAEDLAKGLITKVNESANLQLAVETNPIIETLTNAVSSLNTYNSNIEHFAGDILSDATQFIERALNLDAGYIGETLAGVEETAFDYFETAIAPITKQHENTLNKVREHIDFTEQEVRIITDPIISAVSSDTAKVLTLQQTLTQTLLDRLESTGEGITGSIGKIFSSFLGFNFADSVPDMETLLDPLFTELEADENVPQSLKDALAPGFPMLTPVLLFAVPVILGAVLGGFSASMFQGKILKVQQGSMRRERPALFTPGEIDLLQNRQAISGELAESDLASQGYDTNHISLREKIREVLLPVGELFSLVNRGELSEPEFERQVIELGYSPQSFSALDTLRHPLPSIQDMIRFSVRDVYSPEVVSNFRLDDAYPVEFEDAIAQHGILPEAAHQYWQSHWVLPSIQMGFEMFHRGVIDSDTLQLLFQAQDILPFFREPLTDIAYRPYTRVDIRRMHKFGVLSENNLVESRGNKNELQVAYEDLGFSPDKAQTMVDFTIAYNSPRVDDEPKRLTRAQIIKFYRDKLYSKADSIQQLKDIGYDQPTAELFITLEDLDEYEKQVELSVRVIKTKLRKGVIDYDTAITSFDALNIPAARRDLLITEAFQEKEEDVRLPTKADLDKFLSAGLIDPTIYTARLLDLGYSSGDAQLYLIMETSEEVVEEVFEPVVPRQLTTTQTLNLVREGLLDTTAAVERLIGLGYTMDDAQLLVETTQLE